MPTMGLFANVDTAGFIHSVDRLKCVRGLARKATFRYYQLSVHLEA
jgi:hypothetical protein